MKKYNRGQTLIFLLLIVLLGLTIVGSLAVRTVQDLKQSSYSEQSERAFAAAEAGIEETLRIGLPAIAGGSSDAPTGAFANNSSYNCQVTAVGAGLSGYELYGANAINKDGVMEINMEWPALTPTPTLRPTSVDIYWNRSAGGSAEDNSAIIATFISTQGGNYEATKTAYNPYPAPPFNSSFASSVSGDPVSTTYISKTNITIPNNTKMLRIRPLYNKASIKVIGKNGGSVTSLPVQGYSSRCAGTLGNLKRVVEVAQTNSQLPPIFDYAVFNNDDTGLSHL